MNLIEIIFERLEALSARMSDTSGLGCSEFDDGLARGYERSSDELDDEIAVLRQIFDGYDPEALAAALREFEALVEAEVTPARVADWHRYCELELVLRPYGLIAPGNISRVQAHADMYAITDRGRALLAETP